MSLTFCAVFMQIALLAAEPATTASPDSAEKPKAAVEAQAASKKKEAPKKEDATKKEETSKAEAEAAETYAAAHRVTAKTGKPLVVMVGADWCSPCQTMRRKILPRVREDGLFRKVAFAHVNVDRDKELADELTGGDAVPQLVMYRKTKTGWIRRILVGGHSVEEVEKFINEGLAMDTEERERDTDGATDQSAVQKTADADKSKGEKRRG